MMVSFLSEFPWKSGDAQPSQSRIIIKTILQLNSHLHLWGANQGVTKNEKNTKM